jgi:hypothetical protein
LHELASNQDPPNLYLQVVRITGLSHLAKLEPEILRVMSDSRSVIGKMEDEPAASSGNRKEGIISHGA